MKYKIEKAKYKEVENLINKMDKQGYEFVCFIPFSQSGLGRQQILFKKRK